VPARYDILTAKFLEVRYNTCRCRQATPDVAVRHDTYHGVEEVIQHAQLQRQPAVGWGVTAAPLHRELWVAIADRLLPFCQLAETLVVRAGFMGIHWLKTQTKKLRSILSFDHRNRRSGGGWRSKFRKITLRNSGQLIVRRRDFLRACGHDGCRLALKIGANS